MTELLHACAACGRSGFTTRGLRAHVCRPSPSSMPKPKTQSPAVIDIAPAAASPAAAWSKAKRYVELTSLHLAASCAAQVLAGIELLDIHKHYAGRGRRNDLNVFQDERSWAEAVKAELGVSEATAWRWMEMGKVAKKRLAKDHTDLAALLDQPPSALTEPEREALKRAVHKITDRQTQSELMLEWGITKGTPGGDNRKRDADGKLLPPEPKDDDPLRCPDWAAANPAEKAIWEGLATEGQRLAFIDWRPRLRLILNQVKDPRRGFLADMDEATKGDLVATFCDVLAFVAPHVLKHAPKD